MALTITACASVDGARSTTMPDGRTTAPVAAAPKLGLFSSIKAPSDQMPVLQLTGQGVQIFRCEKRDNTMIWSFRQPEADLFDAGGKAVGKHGANFSFEHVDGSRLVATIVANDEAPQSTDLRWLLMTTRSFNRGAFERVTYVQRVNTKGGLPPARCDAAQSGQLLRVDFTADFVFYRPRADAS
ncbi:MAG: DUF3455 domain-containing protein [Burkholderiaceae bacterium]